jgi:predicted acetyltransferase
MTDPSKSGLEKLEVFRATAQQQAVVSNLLELYAHDFSEFLDVKPGEDGRFGYGNLELYWSNAERHPFLVRLNGVWAGVILVKKGSQASGDPEVWDMAEFFVLRGFRRSGIGTRIAMDVWGKFPGRWEIRVMGRNEAAVQFWRQAVSLFAGDSASTSQFEKDGVRWHLFAFEVPCPVTATILPPG